MKIALSLDGRRTVEASPAAPQNAICPTCGGPLVLRARRGMLGGRSYFWRHASTAHRGCENRNNPITWKRI